MTYERILDVLPDPYLTGILPPESAPDVGVVTSRGCTFPCTYCNFAAMSRRSIAYHSEDRIIRVLRFLEDRLESGKGTKRLIPFNDDNFSLNGKRFHRLLNQMIAEEFENLCFWADMRTESLNNESFELLRQAGFTLLNFGLESAAPKVLASVKKVRASGQLADGYEKEQLYLKRLAWAVEKAKNAGLQTSVSTIFGLPGESEADGLETLDFVKGLGVSGYSHNYLRIFDGTELRESCEEYGIRVTSSPTMIMPRNTVHAYDVFRIPILPHAVNEYSIYSPDMLPAIRMLTGTFSFYDHTKPTSKPLNGAVSGDAAPYSHPQIIALSPGAFDQRLYDWMRHEMHPTTSVWLLQEAFEPREAFLGVLAAGGVPISLMNGLRLQAGCSGRRRWRVNELSRTAPTSNTRVIHEVPFVEADERIMLDIARGERAAALLTISSKSDVDSLSRMADSAEASGSIKFSGAHLKTGAVAADGCRWGHRICPAVSGTRWFVDDDQNIRPCLSGEPLGRVGDSYADLRASAVSLMQAKQFDRGCGQCPIERICSKCLFPFPLGNAEFCTFKKSRPLSPMLIESLSSLPKLRQAGAIDGGETEFSICSLRGLCGSDFPWWRISTPLEQFILVRGASARQGMLFHPGKGLITRLTELQSNLLELGAEKAVQELKKLTGPPH
jgi:hypothetical protein